MTFDDLLKIIMAIGIPTICGALISIGRKLQILDDLKTNVGEVKSDCKKIWQTLAGHGKEIQGLKAHTKYGYSNSPTIPNEMGRKLLEESGFNKIYPELREEIFGLMNSWGLRTLYDYEKGAEKALKQLQNNPIIDPLKNHAVNHPSESLELIFKVASWIIREDYAKSKSDK